MYLSCYSHWRSFISIRSSRVRRITTNITQATRKLLRLALSKNTCHTAALFPQHGFSQVDLWGQKQEGGREGVRSPHSSGLSSTLPTPSRLYLPAKCNPLHWVGSQRANPAHRRWSPIQSPDGVTEVGRGPASCRCCTSVWSRSLARRALHLGGSQLTSGKSSVVDEWVSSAFRLQRKNELNPYFSSGLHGILLPPNVKGCHPIPSMVG